jgi:hypothetical protein
MVKSYNMGTTVKNNETCDHRLLNGMIFWDGSRKQNAEHASGLSYTYNSYIVSIDWDVEDVDRNEMEQEYMNEMLIMTTSKIPRLLSDPSGLLMRVSLRICKRE